MENAGAVTIRDQYVFRSKVTDAAYETRAETILHELVDVLQRRTARDQPRCHQPLREALGTADLLAGAGGLGGGRHQVQTEPARVESPAVRARALRHEPVTASGVTCGGRVTPRVPPSGPAR
ncbi:hypothetical protein DLE01_06300 [Streptomyces sp. FT05W]|nr:hypothetical protein DLE01_06300 [Streptomyces sp. FT05W]